MLRRIRASVADYVRILLYVTMLTLSKEDLQLVRAQLLQLGNFPVLFHQSEHVFGQRYRVSLAPMVNKPE